MTGAAPSSSIVLATRASDGERHVFGPAGLHIETRRGYRSTWQGGVVAWCRLMADEGNLRAFDYRLTSDGEAMVSNWQAFTQNPLQPICSACNVSRAAPAVQRQA